MNNILWNKEQLKNIKTIILSRASLKLTDDLVFEQRGLSCYNGFPKTGKPLYIELQDELIDLFYTVDKKEIEKVLFKASQIKLDETNNIGFLNNISKVSPTRLEDIFIIFKEIISQYEKAIDLVAKSSLENYDNPKDAQNRIKEITESTEETFEEKLIKTIINKIFIQANGVTESVLFENLINKTNSLIKAKLVSRMQSIVNIQLRNEGKKEEEKFYGSNFPRQSSRNRKRH